MINEEDLKWKEVEEVDQEKKEQHLEIDTYQHLDKDKEEKGALIE